MTEYVIKVILCQVILYLFFHFFLAREKMHRFNRFYLVFSLFFSIIIPMIKIPAYFPMAIDFSPLVFPDNNSVSYAESNHEFARNNTSFTSGKWLIVFYVLVLLFFIVRMIRNLFRINLVAMVYEKINYKGYEVVLTEKRILPYSFLKRVFINQADYNNGKISEELLMHEICHIQQHHSIDIIIMEIVQALFWFNPILILHNKAIRLNHEYLADGAVINNQVELGNYQNVLVNAIAENNLMSMTSGFSAIWTKKRLWMMTKRNSVLSSWLRVFLAIPILFLITVSFVFSNADRDIKYEQKITWICNNYPNFYGCWEGSGRFNNVSLHDEVGNIDVQINVNKDHSIEGTIGDASFKDARIISRRYGIEIQAYLSEPVKDNYKIDKDRVIFLWGLPEIEKNKADVNFHLVNNFFLDFYFNVGGVILTKSEDN